MKFLERGRGRRPAASVSGFMRMLALRAPAALGGILAVALLVSACATTKVDVLWTNPDFAARKIEGKVLVVGLTRDPAMRRMYEDELATKFAARGIGAIRSYQVLQGAFGADGSRPTLEAARRAGATAILASAVIGHEHLARGISFDEPAPRWAGAYEGWYGHYWPYLYRRTEVQVTERYIASTTLIDVDAGKLRWTVRTHTDATGNGERDIREFAGVIVEALGKNGLL